MTYAFVFPGQGSQSVGMLSDMSEHSPTVAATFAEASEVLGYDLWNLVSNGPVEELGQTAITQPAILTASVALWRIWCEKTDSARPPMMAGHSLGEYSALVCAGALNFRDAVELVAARGRLMQEAVPEGEGAMSIIMGLDDAAVVTVCAEAAGSGVVEAVNFNSPGQVVIAGDSEAVARAGVAAKEAGAKRALPLPVSVPAHSSLMRKAAEQFADKLLATEVNPPASTVLQNVGIDKVSDIRDSLVKQLYSPVPWTQIVQTLAAQGVTQLVECGPGKVLCGLGKRIDRSLASFPLESPDAMLAAIEAVTADHG
ncbi:MAG: ACP S-malonyltransferase [Gammaproteobacteria bacterium]